MYKCLNCGHIFEEGEQGHYFEKHGLDCAPYEEWSCCPCCGSSDFEETKRCKICGSEFLKDELLNGACRDCIIESINDSDNFLEYLEETDQISCFMYFMNQKHEPKTITDEDIKILKSGYILESKMNPNFLKICTSYVLGGGEKSLENYAEWI